MKTTLERFMEKVVVPEDRLECWGWKGCISGNGYPPMRVGGRQGSVHNVHRVAYQLFVGDIPEGFQIDHLCRNRVCTNPAHLEAVTSLENNRRVPTSNFHKTHCKRGHEFSPLNTVIEAGKRRCVTCRQRQALKRGPYRKTYPPKPKPLRVFPCPGCGETITTTDPRTMYCSVRCCNKVAYLRRKQLAAERPLPRGDRRIA